MGYSDFFKRALFSTRQRLTSSDLNRAQAYAATTQQLILSALGGRAALSSPTATRGQVLSTYAPTGFYGASFIVTVNSSAPPRGVSIAPGLGYGISGPATASDIDGDTGANWYGDLAAGAPVVLSAAQNLTVPASPTVGNSRIDIIEVKASYFAAEPQTVGIFNAITRVFDATSRNSALSWDLAGHTGTVNAPNPSTAAISYVVGQTAAGGISAATEPATTSGYIKIARINLAGAVAIITQDLIADLRPAIRPAGMLNLSALMTLPGTSAGLGSEAIDAVELPPGVQLKVAIATGSAPATGNSYVAECYVIGGDTRAATLPFTRGVATASIADSSLTNRRIPLVYNAGSGFVDISIRNILNGTTSGYSLLSGAETYAIGQPVSTFNVRVVHPAGASAISSTEKVAINFMMSQG